MVRRKKKHKRKQIAGSISLGEIYHQIGSAHMTWLDPARNPRPQ